MNSRREAEARDARDPLARFRTRFELPDVGVYLAGNSLGAAPRGVCDTLRRVVERAWARDLVASWELHGWIDLPTTLGDRIGSLIGALPGEVIVADSTSINLFKVLSAAVRMRPGRRKVISDSGNFPTDLYVAHAVASSSDGATSVSLVEGEDVEGSLDADTAVLTLSHVNFRDGLMHDLTGLTAAAHRAGALVVWDLSHSVGVVPLSLAADGVDFAVGCTYKYLNGGPGAPAFLYVADRYKDVVDNPIPGWLGHALPFSMAREFSPAPGVTRMLTGTPPVLSLMALDGALALVLEADMGDVRRKSVELTEMFIELVEVRCRGLAVKLASPRDAVRRGSQVCFRHDEAYSVVRALAERGVVGDFREPDILRFGLAPLYNRFVDVWDAVESLRDVLATGAWDRDELRTRGRVT